MQHLKASRLRMSVHGPPAPSHIINLTPRVCVGAGVASRQRSNWTRLRLSRYNTSAEWENCQMSEQRNQGNFYNNIGSGTAGSEV